MIESGLEAIRQRFAGIDDVPGRVAHLRWELVSYAWVLRKTLRRAKVTGLTGRYLRSVLASIRRNPSGDLARPVFIVGSPRSGTTFLGSCFDAVSTFAYFFEPAASMLCNGLVFEGVWSRSFAESYYRRVFWFLLLCSGTIGRRFCEKGPPNVFVIPLLAEFFPDAKFIHLLRDGRDVAASLLERGWLNHVPTEQGSSLTARDFRYAFFTGTGIGAYPRYWVEPQRRMEFLNTTDSHRCIWCWRRHVEYGISAGRSLPESRYLEVRYEDMVREPRATAATMMKFLEVDDVSTVEAFGNAMSRIHADSIGKHRRNTDGVLDVAGVEEAGKLLARLGYNGGPARPRPASV